MATINAEFVEVEGSPKKESKVLRFFADHLDAIMTIGGGLCVLTAAILNCNEGNSYVYASSTEGDIYKVRAKKVKNLKEVKAVKHSAVMDSVED